MSKSATYKLLMTVALATGLTSSYGQTDSANAYENMSLRELLNVKIVSASKADEALFEAPLSSSVITRGAIRRNGCTTIMEALRLVPGLIVCEQTNGNFDVQLRGTYTTPNAFFDGSSATTLVMVDNRPIFNYLKGSTFWETIPVGIHDIERIEVILGPAGALYGPNAVSGVINIITRQAIKEGLSVTANSVQGTYHTNLNNGSIGYKADKWGVTASGNYQHRERTQTSYYEIARNSWIEPKNNSFISILGDTLRDSKGLVPYPELAMEKYGANVFANYDPSAKLSLNLSTGLQHSLVQKVFAENSVGPLTTSASDTRYIDLRAKAGKLSAQLSFINGTQTLDHRPGNKYDFHTWDASVDYSYNIGSLLLKPGLSYRSAVYDDTRYTDSLNKFGIFNARGELITRSAFLRSEYKMLNKKLRLIAALGANSFNHPDKIYLAYEFAATYKLNKNHLLRAVYSSTPRSGSVYDTYVNQTVPTISPIGPNKFFQFQLQGNKNAALLTSDMLELGYRAQFTKELNIDVDMFYTTTTNYSAIVMQAAQEEMRGVDTVLLVPLSATNLPMVGKQVGASFALTYSSEKWLIKPYITLQRSTVKNYAPYSVLPDAPATFINLDPGKNNIYSGMGSSIHLTSSPDVYGGIRINYTATEQLYVNVNAYYLGKQTFYHSTNIVFNDGMRGVDVIKGKCIANANVFYKLSDRLTLSVLFRNILNNTNREFYKTDEIPFRFLTGIKFEL